MTIRHHAVRDSSLAILLAAAMVLMVSLVRPQEAHANELPYYYLPWSSGQQHYVLQGNNDPRSHTGIHAWAWDFDQPGWIVHAARAGVVTHIYDGYDGYDASSDCDPGAYSYANYVVVKSVNPDGTAWEAQYMHLARGSASIRVALNQAIAAGTILGVTDHTGYVCGSGHLHYQVQGDCGLVDCQSVPSSFLDPDVLSQDPTDGVPKYPQTLRAGRSDLRTDTATVYGNGSYQVNLARGPSGSSYLWSSSSGTGFPADYVSQVFPGHYFPKTTCVSGELDPLTSLFVYNQFSGGYQFKRADGSGRWTTVTTGYFTSTGYQIYPGNYVFGQGLTSFFFYRPSDGWMGIDVADGCGGFTPKTWAQWTPNLSIYQGHFANHSLTDILVYNPSTGGENVFIADGNGYFNYNPTGGIFGPPSNLNLFLGSFYDGDYRTSVFFYHPSDGWAYVYEAGFDLLGGGGWFNGYWPCPQPPHTCYATGFTALVGSFAEVDNYLDKRELLNDLFWINPATGSWSVATSYGAGLFQNQASGTISYANGSLILPIHLNSSGNLTDLLFVGSDGTERVWLANGFSGFTPPVLAGGYLGPGPTVAGDFNQS